MVDSMIVRAVFVFIMGGTAYFLQPLQLAPITSAVFGCLLGMALIAIEVRMQRIGFNQLLGGVAGIVCGLVIALLVSIVIEHAAGASNTAPYLQLVGLMVGIYLGGTVGARKGQMLQVPGLGGTVSGSASHSALMVLDTSVIIDGRIADIAETGFLDGAVGIPQFVLHELQMVADSPDSLKRNRGRRGLEILQRIQKMPRLQISVIERDFPQIREVDMKLVELGKQMHAKVVTNDFNLNKVAQLHGVEVLNINELANALKPVVLPGEIMRVFVLKEGKEHNQGVAYLDDGTMVVVDNARRQISKTIDIAVSSVLQTTAGKMIFGKFDERVHAVYEKTGPNHHVDRQERAPRDANAAAPQA